MVTDDESHMIRLSGPSEISIFALSPPTSLNPLPAATDDLKSIAEALGLHSPVSKIRTDSTIRGLFVGPSKRFGTGQSDVDPLAGGVGVWLGEYKGQPASVNLYTLRVLRDVGNGSLPVTQARKSFFKGDKVVLKWNKIGSMVSSRWPVFSAESEAVRRGGGRSADASRFVLLAGPVPDHFGRGQFRQVVLRRNQSLPRRSERAVRMQGRPR